MERERVSSVGGDEKVSGRGLCRVLFVHVDVSFRPSADEIGRARTPTVSGDASGGGGGSTTTRSQQPHYRGILRSVRTIVSEEGVRGLYRGLPPTLAGVGPNLAINFAA